MKQKHTKHAKITRPDLGNYCRNEWAILGTPCGVIQQLSQTLIAALGDSYTVAYVDADHKSADEETALPATLASKGNLEYTDKIDFHQLNFHGALTPFKNRVLFNEQDVVLVNGNHFKAKNQIVVLDEKKLESLSRKLDRLTNVELLLFTDSVNEIPDFLKQHIATTSIPQLSINDTAAIVDFVRNKIKNSVAPLYGLVLAGGKSQRMGKDKGSLDYHGKEQREHIGDLLNQLTEEVYLSARPDQELPSQFSVLQDRFIGLGPFGAILTAFLQNPNAAWLVTACDLPFLDEKGLNQLIEARNPSKIGTAFYNEATDFPDPLCTIWEPRAYPVLMQFLTQGYSCPRKVLINSDIELVNPLNENLLRNVNTPEELEAVIREMKGS